jgi:hypothetical protein
MLVSNPLYIFYSASDLLDSLNELLLSCYCNGFNFFSGILIAPFYPLRAFELGNSTPSFFIYLSN